MNAFFPDEGLVFSLVCTRAWSRLKRSIAWLLLALWLGGSPASVLAAQLFRDTPLPLAAPRALPQAKRTRQAVLDPASPWAVLQPVQTPAPTITLNLFSDLVVTGVLDTITAPGPGRSVLRGHVDGQQGSYFLLARESNVMAGTVFIPKRGTFLIQYAGAGKHTVLETDPAHLPGCGVQQSAPQASMGTPVAPPARPRAPNRGCCLRPALRWWTCWCSTPLRRARAPGAMRASTPSLMRPWRKRTWSMRTAG